MSNQEIAELIQEAILDAEHGPHKDSGAEWLNGYRRGLYVALQFVLSERQVPQ